MIKTIWIGLDKNKNIIAFWTKGYEQDFNKWRKGVKSIGAVTIQKHYIWVDS